MRSGITFLALGWPSLLLPLRVPWVSRPCRFCSRCIIRCLRAIALRSRDVTGSRAGESSLCSLSCFARLPRCSWTSLRRSSTSGIIRASRRCIWTPIANSVGGSAIRCSRRSWIWSTLSTTSLATVISASVRGFLLTMGRITGVGGCETKVSQGLCYARKRACLPLDESDSPCPPGAGAADEDSPGPAAAASAAPELTRERAGPRRVENRLRCPGPRSRRVERPTFSSILSMFWV